jgi:hypothetical protein
MPQHPEQTRVSGVPKRELKLGKAMARKWPPCALACLKVRANFSVDWRVRKMNQKMPLLNPKKRGVETQIQHLQPRKNDGLSGPTFEPEELDFEPE